MLIHAQFPGTPLAADALLAELGADAPPRERRPGAEWYSGPARHDAEVVAARRLHTRRYVERGAVARPDGDLFDDGWMDRREWVVVAHDGEVVGAASLVAPTHTLPTLAAFGLDVSTDARLSEAWAQGRVREVSTLCRESVAVDAPTVRGLLYRALWRAREETDTHDQWLMSMGRKEFDHLLRLFPVPFELLGRTRQYYGEPSVACMLDLDLARHALLLRAPALLTWLDDDGRVRPLVPVKG